MIAANIETTSDDEDKNLASPERPYEEEKKEEVESLDPHRMLTARSEEPIITTNISEIDANNEEEEKATDMSVDKTCTEPESK